MTHSKFPFGFVAVGLAILLLGLCIPLPFEIHISGLLSYISPSGIALIACCALLGIPASEHALPHSNLGQKLLGVASAIFSSWILTVSVMRILQHLPN